MKYWRQQLGTNYYLVINKCGCCNRQDKFHIGKKSIGWQFSFQGFVRDELISVRSWTEWRKIILTGEIFDEYDRPLTVDEFVSIVENSRKEKLNHFDQCSLDFDDWTARVQDGVDWKDEEGWSFCSGDFC